MLSSIPLMAVPFILYNVLAFTGIGAEGVNGIWDQVLFSITMVSGTPWSMTMGDLLIMLGLLLLFFEILKATRIGNTSIIDHLLSTFVFVAYLVEFLLIGKAATSVFFILMFMTLIDVMAGFSVSIRSATRDVSLGDSF